jgi:hypothetical protein
LTMTTANVCTINCSRNISSPRGLVVKRLTTILPNFKPWNQGFIRRSWVRSPAWIVFWTSAVMGNHSATTSDNFCGFGGMSKFLRGDDDSDILQRSLGSWRCLGESLGQALVFFGQGRSIPSMKTLFLTRRGRNRLARREL